MAPFVPDQPSGCIDPVNQAIRVNIVAGGGGGGGGPATIADGADVAQGATTDAAVTSDSNGTLSAKLRGLVKILADIWDSVNHRIRVDGSGVTQPVSGTVTANAGTNLNTSALALEAGGNLAAIKTDVDKIPSQGQALSSASMPVVLPAAQITTLTPLASVGVNNFPATQPVSGTVAVSNLPTLGPQPSSGSTSVVLAGDQQIVTNIQDTTGEALLGTNNALNVHLAGNEIFNLDGNGNLGVNVQGTLPVSVAATLPVSAVALPLPANAVQEAGGNVAAIAASDQFNPQMVDLLKQILAAIQYQNILLASSFGTQIDDADAISSTLIQ